MSNGKNGLYVTKNAPDQAPMQEPVQDQAQAQNNQFADWEKVDSSELWEQIDKKESSYQTEYRKHKDMQQILSDEKRRNSRGEEIEDSPLMQAVKRDMNAVSSRLEEEIPEDKEAFRQSLFSTAALYDKLIKSCQDYIDGHSPWSSVGKRRKKMVADLKERAIEERRCFANIGASDHIHKDREDGMIMGNVLGNLAEMSRMQIIDQDAVQLDRFRKADEYLLYNHKVEDTEGNDVDDLWYIVGKDADKLDRSSGHAQAANDLMNYLGVGELFIKTETVAVADALGRRYMGIRKAADYNSSDTNYKTLLEQYPGKNVNLTFSAEAVRQLSILQVMLALFGRTDFDFERNIYFVGDEDGFSEEVNYRVSQVYINYGAGDLFFSGKTNGEDLKKKNDKLPAFSSFKLPGLDKHFATAVLSMGSEDLDFITGTLLNKDEKKAFASRLAWMQKLISDRMKEEENLPEDEKTILDKEKWRSKDNVNRLQNMIWRDNPQLFPGMLRKNQIRQNQNSEDGAAGVTGVKVHIEGASEGTGNASAEYEALYTEYYSRILALKSDSDRYAALTDLLFLCRTMEGEYKEDPKMISSFAAVLNRLQDEFLSDHMLMEHFEHRMQTLKRFKEAYDKLAKEIKEIPKEYINQKYYKEKLNGKYESLKKEAEKDNEPFNEETARRKAEESVKERLLRDYIIFRIQEEQPELMYEQYRFSVYAPQLIGAGAYRNRILDPAFKFIDNRVIEVTNQYKRSYDKMHGEGAFNKASDDCLEIDTISITFNFIDDEKREAAKRKFLNPLRVSNPALGISFDEKGLLKKPSGRNDEPFNRNGEPLDRIVSLKEEIEKAGTGHKEHKAFLEKFNDYFDTMLKLCGVGGNKELNADQIELLRSKCAAAEAACSNYTKKGNKNDPGRQRAALKAEKYLNLDQKLITYSLNEFSDGQRLRKNLTIAELLKDDVRLSEVKDEMDAFQVLDSKEHYDAQTGHIEKRVEKGILREQDKVKVRFLDIFDPKVIDSTDYQKARQIMLEGGTLTEPNVNKEVFEKTGGSSFHMVVPKSTADLCVKKSGGFLKAVDEPGEKNLRNLIPTMPEKITLPAVKDFAGNIIAPEREIELKKCWNFFIKGLMCACFDEHGNPRKELSGVKDDFNGKDLTVQELFDTMLYDYDYSTVKDLETYRGLIDTFRSYIPAEDLGEFDKLKEDFAHLAACGCSESSHLFNTEAALSETVRRINAFSDLDTSRKKLILRFKKGISALGLDKDKSAEDIQKLAEEAADSVISDVDKTKENIIALQKIGINDDKVPLVNACSSNTRTTMTILGLSRGKELNEYERGNAYYSISAYWEYDTKNRLKSFLDDADIIFKMYGKIPDKDLVETLQGYYEKLERNEQLKDDEMNYLKGKTEEYMSYPYHFGAPLHEGDGMLLTIETYAAKSTQYMVEPFTLHNAVGIYKRGEHLLGKDQDGNVIKVENGLKPSEKLDGFREYYNVMESIPKDDVMILKAWFKETNKIKLED